eukprot:1042737_1
MTANQSVIILSILAFKTTRITHYFAPSFITSLTTLILIIRSTQSILCPQYSVVLIFTLCFSNPFSVFNDASSSFELPIHYQMHPRIDHRSQLNLIYNSKNMRQNALADKYLIHKTKRTDTSNIIHRFVCTLILTLHPKYDSLMQF